MKLVRYRINEEISLGVVVEGRVHDIAGYCGTASMREALSRLVDIREALNIGGLPSVPLADVKLEAPITDPQKVLAIGMNYKAHAQEALDAGIAVPPYQTWFNKQVSCLTGPRDPIVLPAVSNQLDYEAELVVVIGTRCRNVLRSNARSVIAGYMIGNDVSARDWQHRTPTFTLGKSFDTHGPIGPWIVTDDEVSDPHALTMFLTVNGEERQRASTGDMIYDIYDQIEYLSTVMTLEPGDLLFSGTPAGVGAAMKPQRWLVPGDRVQIAISGIGQIENLVIAV